MAMAAREKAEFLALIRDLTERLERLEQADKPEKRGPGRPKKEQVDGRTETAD